MWAQNDDYIYVDIHVEPNNDNEIKITNEGVFFKQGEYQCNLVLHANIIEDESKYSGKRIYEFKLKKDDDYEWVQLLKDKYTYNVKINWDKFDIDEDEYEMSGNDDVSDGMPDMGGGMSDMASMMAGMGGENGMPDMSDMMGQCCEDENCEDENCEDENCEDENCEGCDDGSEGDDDGSVVVVDDDDDLEEDGSVVVVDEKSTE
jgi:hypothetical protein